MTQEQVKQLEENVKTVRANMNAACEKIGKDPKDVMLVAATKMNDAERVAAALQFDIDAAGENRVQELMDKYEQHAYDGKPLHFIGTLQTNKVKYLMGKVSLIHSVSSVKLAKAIGKEAIKHGLVQDILVEINVGGEESKSGISVDEVYTSMEEISKIEGIHVRGLMTIPPRATYEGENNVYFHKMHELFVDISSKKYDNVDMDYLSMGMSDDYAEAIACGANIVRVGTAIFGARDYSKK
jgi:pyridoxal phosphate enzyme (YggS family)